MATRTITTAQPYVTCDVCGRGLLRGELSDVFLDAGHRRTVCELCLPRATQEGWTREGGEEAPTVRPPRRRRRSLISRLLAQRPSVTVSRDRTQKGARDQEPGAPRGVSAAEPRSEPRGQVRSVSRRTHRSVHAVPTSTGIQVSRAIEAFNAGLEPRRIAGVARALGAPSVTARPAQAAGTVSIVVAWELCWYRFEVDLAEAAAGARLVAEGLELADLEADDLAPNASADEHGELRLVGS